MTAVAVVTDSAADLPAKVAASAGIRVVPLTVTLGAESFLEGEELSPEEFWRRAEAGPDLPTTASPAPASLIALYEEAARAGAEGLVSVHVSAALSRTADTARLAASEASLPVEVVDSRSVSLGQGLVALVAAEAAAEGLGVAAAAGAARRAVRELRLFAFLDTVEFLKRGGRVGRAKAAMSDLLRIRPILTLEDGEPALVSKPRTRRRAAEELLARAGVPARAAGVFHGGAPEAGEVAAELELRCGVRPLVSLIGAVTGTHLGPRALGVAVLPLSLD